MGKPHSRVIYRDAVKSKKEAAAGSVGAGFIHQLGTSNDGAYETVGRYIDHGLLIWGGCLLTRKILALGEGLTLKMGHRWGDPGGSGAVGDTREGRAGQRSTWSA